jgi:hypothetical protein
LAASRLVEAFLFFKSDSMVRGVGAGFTETCVAPAEVKTDIIAPTSSATFDNLILVMKVIDINTRSF